MQSNRLDNVFSTLFTTTRHCLSSLSGQSVAVTLAVQPHRLKLPSSILNNHRKAIKLLLDGGLKLLPIVVF
jgi:hypothetical protein